MYDSMRESAQSGEHNQGFMKGMQQALSALDIYLDICQTRLPQSSLTTIQVRGSRGLGHRDAHLSLRLPNNRRNDVYPQPLVPMQSVGGGSEMFALTSTAPFCPPKFVSCSASVLAATPSLLCLDDAMAFPAPYALGSVVVLALRMRNISFSRVRHCRVFGTISDVYLMGFTMCALL